MRIFGEYLRRLFQVWFSWLFTALDLLGFVLLIIDVVDPGYLFPRWVYILFLILVTFLGLIAANAKLFAQLESEKRDLQAHVDVLEDTRADIRFKKVEDDPYVPHHPAHFFELDHDQSRKLHSGTGLTEQGLPVGAVLSARLRGEKKSYETGVLVWEIAEIDLPPLFVSNADNIGSFMWAHFSQPFDRIRDWKDDFSAVYELPVEIQWEGTPRAFVQELASLDSYRVVVNYWTERGIDSVSETRCLILEGSFEWLRDELCDRWKWNCFRELAQLAGCSRDL